MAVGIGSFPRCSSHHCRNWASGFIKNGDVGAGASAEALPTSYPLQIRFIAAEIAHVSRRTGCSIHAAYVPANVIAAL